MTDIKEWTAEYYIEHKELCDELLMSIDLEKIPSVNYLQLQDLKDGQLVRFSGMIQDMYNPEFYIESYRVKNLSTGTVSMRPGMFKDTVKSSANEEVDYNCEENKTSERQTCVMISIPGLNDWAQEYTFGKKLDTYNNKDKGEVTPKNLTEKRALDDDEPMDTTEPVQKKEKLSDSGMEIADKSEPSKSEPKVIISKDHLLNFPIPMADGKACIVKIYNDNPYKLNQLLDIIGFISLDPMLSALTSDETMDDIEVAEAQTHNPPASLIPRLHAVKISPLARKIVFQNNSIMSKATSIRTDLHLVLSQLLFGDELAADYVICNLISRIYTRKDYLCLGNFPLNITGFSVEKFPNFTTTFYEILKLFVAKSHLFECTLDNLNESSLIPQKDYDCNRLTSGILQLSDNTHLIIDETKLITGQVTENGKRNYQAVSDLIKFQKINYDFKYYNIEYETDIPVLILSEVKSFIPCVLQIPIKVDEETIKVYSQVIEATKQFLRDQERLNNLREYLEILRDREFKLKEDITDVIQEDFVELRRTDSKLFTADSLHQIMVFARLLALSYGEDALTLERWKVTLELEKSRLARLHNTSK